MPPPTAPDRSCWSAHASYCFVALWTQRQESQNAFQPFLKVVDDNDNISRDELGQYLVYEDTYLECCNDAYVVKDIALSEINRFLLTHDMKVILVVFDKKAFELSGKLVGDIEEL